MNSLLVKCQHGDYTHALIIPTDEGIRIERCDDNRVPMGDEAVEVILYKDHPEMKNLFRDGAWDILELFDLLSTKAGCWR